MEVRQQGNENTDSPFLIACHSPRISEDWPNRHHVFQNNVEMGRHKNGKLCVVVRSPDISFNRCVANNMFQHIGCADEVIWSKDCTNPAVSWCDGDVLMQQTCAANDPSGEECPFKEVDCTPQGCEYDSTTGITSCASK